LRRADVAGDRTVEVPAALESQEPVTRGRWGGCRPPYQPDDQSFLNTRPLSIPNDGSFLGPRITIGMALPPPSRLNSGSTAFSRIRLNPRCVSEIFASMSSVPLKSSSCDFRL